MTTTPKFGFRLIAPNSSESAKATAANENALLFEAAAAQYAISRSTSAPPGSPASGDVYIVPAVGSSPAVSGAWAGHEAEIAVYYNGWVFMSAVPGARWYVADEGVFVYFDASVSPGAWTIVADDPDAIHSSVPGEIDALTEKVAPVAGDWLILEDSEDSFNKVKVDAALFLGGGSGSGGGASAFIDLTDVPASYSGEGGKGVFVNAGETGLDFVAQVTSGERLAGSETDPRVFSPADVAIMAALHGGGTSGGGSGIGYFGAAVGRDSSNQTLTTATNTPISWDTAYKNADGFWSGGTPTRLTVPGGTPDGLYRVTFTADSVAVNVAMVWLAWIDLNGAATTPGEGMAAHHAATGTTYSRCASVTVDVVLSASDYVQGYVVHTRGSNLDAIAGACKMSIQLLAFV